MKTKNKVMEIIIVACVVVLAFCLAGCSPSNGSSSSTLGDSGSDGTGTVAWEDLNSSSGQALKSIHPQEITGGYATSNCLTCHDYDKLSSDCVNDLNEGGKQVFDQHAGHVDYECVDCHSLESAPVLQCNNCHEMSLPEGWENPTSEKAMYVDPDTIYGDLGYGTQGYSYGMDPQQVIAGTSVNQ